MKTFSSVFALVLLPILLSGSIAQINWIKDPGNPVMSGGASGSWNKHVFMPCVLYNSDSSRYEMWFSASNGRLDWRPYRIGFATSPDGITWTNYPDPVLQSVTGTWEESTVEAAMVIRENGTYKMWYSGWSPDSSGIGYATSSDGINWAKYTGNPILESSTDAWEAGINAYCCVIADENSGYKMWYGGSDVEESKWQTGYATSPDGIIWIKADSLNPVFSPGRAGQWDEFAAGCYGPGIIVIDDIYHMFYTGMQTDGEQRKIGWAKSLDGLQWNKYNDPATTSSLYEDSDPVLRPVNGQWDHNLIESGTVLLNDDTLHMWYSGSGSTSGEYLWRIGHATLSLDSLAKYTVLSIKKYDNTFIPKGHFLAQNYPNPFNPITNIQFQIHNSQFVTLNIYNILGEKVATLVQDKLQAGSHIFQFNASKLASGVYLYRIEAGEFQDVKKMILLR